jgi:hypothetical protein
MRSPSSDPNAGQHDPSSDREALGSELLFASKEIGMAKTEPHVDERSEPMRSPIAAAVILLVIYVAMYLAVAGVVHLITPPDVYAHVPAQSPERVDAHTD